MCGVFFFERKEKQKGWVVALMNASRSVQFGAGKKGVWKHKRDMRMRVWGGGV